MEKGTLNTKRFRLSGTIDQDQSSPARGVEGWLVTAKPIDEAERRHRHHSPAPSSTTAKRSQAGATYASASIRYTAACCQCHAAGSRGAAVDGGESTGPRLVPLRELFLSVRWLGPPVRHRLAVVLWYGPGRQPARPSLSYLIFFPFPFPFLF